MFWKTVGLLSALGAASLAVAYYLPPLVVRMRQVGRLRHAGAGKLALSYDDGPDDSLTPQLLDLLDRYQVKATFFMVGFRAEKLPEVCARMAASGHELGTHTYSHRSAWSAGPFWTVHDIQRAYEVLNRWIGPSAPFRPPMGKVTLPVLWAIRRRGAPVYWWTHRGCDTLDPLPEAAGVAEQILQDSAGVVLMHCHHKEPERRRYVLELTERLISGALARGRKLCTVSEVLKP